MAPSGYVICGTPRSGSTLLCRLLTDSRVAGQPHSYFREPDIAYWADSWDVDHANGTENAAFNRSYLAAMHRAGQADTGLFGLRLMWPSLADAAERLNDAAGTTADVVTSLRAAFGPLLFIHISRRDKLAQAVSLLKAQQSGLWHLAADGSVLEGQARPGALTYDGNALAEIINELIQDDTAWSAFFAAHGIAPLQLTYEKLTSAPLQALADILATLGCDPAIATTLAIPTARMADATSLEWMERFRRESGR